MDLFNPFNSNDGNDLQLSFEKCETCMHSRFSPCSEKQFLKSVTIWINKPHVVNRRLCGSKLLALLHLDTYNEIQGRLCNCLESLRFRCLTHGAATAEKTTVDNLDLSNITSPFTVIIRELIPKSEHFPALIELIIYDKNARTVTFIPCGESWREAQANKLISKEVTYCIQFRHHDTDVARVKEENEVSLFWKCDHKQKVVHRQQITSHWLSSVLLEKLLSWSHVRDICTSTTSLKLVTVDSYKDIYVDLKNKYGKDLVKNWTERTDPKKYVYEDIAIAAYLLLVWEEDRVKKNLPVKQSFVDLGCGNGLLVYILNKEGHKGLGIDLKKRKIWDTFGPDVNLKEQPITPSADHLFPEYDWLIGNHSDELTPWIPVIAARSSYHCNFFVLPCCPYDFVGKYGRAEKGKSQYSSYLDYIEDVVEKCGFEPEQDTLRIPSTKRICYIGRKRTYDIKNESSVDSLRQSFINNQIARYRCKTKNHLQQSDASLSDGLPICKSESNMNTLENSVEPTMTGNEEASGVRENLGFERLDSGLGSLESDVFYSDSGSPLDENPFQSQSSDGTDTNVTKRKLGNLDVDVCLNLHASHEKKVCLEENAEPFTMECEKISIEVQDSLSNYEVKPDLFSEPAWASNFQVRPVQTIRNCQNVPEDVKLKIVERVFQMVLDAKQTCESTQEDGLWHKGGVVPISEAAQLIDKSVLHQLKSECGGLQTLLRNHSHIFQVTRGKICLRDFTKAEPWEGRNPKKVKGKKMDRIKTILCWFHDHHPDGCPKVKEMCLFAHGKDDLREKNVSVKT